MSAAHSRAGAAPATLVAVELSIVMPCLNEARTLGACIERAQEMLQTHGIDGEIVIADNGSTDGSQEIAIRLGARVVHVTEKGYGSALMGGVAAAHGRYIVMGDADCSYDFAETPPLLERLRSGNDLVMGNRFRGGIKPKAMPPLHRYFGNPLLTRLGRLLFKSPCADFQCGLRGFSRDAFQRMDLQTTGMEFASEMVVKATLFGMRIAEVPVTLSPDGRDRRPHLRTWRDGWRYLRFLLLCSPRWLFLYPGALLMLAGTAVGTWLLPGPRRIGSITFDVHTLVYAAMAVLVGFQGVTFATFTKIFAISEGLLPPDPRLTRAFRYVTLETGLVVGAAMIVAGTGGTVYAFGAWAGGGFGPLQTEHTLRAVVPAALLITLGVQTVLSSFFLSVLGMKHK